MSLERETRLATRLAERLLHHPALALPGPGISFTDLDPCSRLDRVIAALLPPEPAPEEARPDEVASAAGAVPAVLSTPPRSAERSSVGPPLPRSQPPLDLPPARNAAVRAVPAPARRAPGAEAAGPGLPLRAPASPPAVAAGPSSALPPGWMAVSAPDADRSPRPVTASPDLPQRPQPSAAPAQAAPEPQPAQEARSPGKARVRALARIAEPELATAPPAAPALRLAASPKALAALLESHVTPAAAPDDPEAAALWPWARPANAPAPAVASALPAHPLAALATPAARPAAQPPAPVPGGAKDVVLEERVVDAVLERLEDRLREESIRRFGLTGGEL